ncbi:MAG: acetolactate synthase small subunit [Bacteroidales bacterium]|nr:acetolactate synthase small subunit [Bacteroidales bacterium]MBR5255181.1 acetolactate synthase small subunit [Bacteroidales bacterium]
MVQTVMENEIKEYTVTIYTENQIGLLAQITNVFTRHGLSIWSLSAGATSMEGVHNITIVTAGSEKKVRESVQQIEKRVDVIKVFFYTADKIVYRELCLYKVPTPALMEYGDIETLLNRYHARIVEMNKVFTVIQKTGLSDETAALHDDLKSVGVLQFVRSGRIAVSRAEQEPVFRFLKKREKERKQQLNNK